MKLNINRLERFFNSVGASEVFLYNLVLEHFTRKEIRKEVLALLTSATILS